MSSFLSPTGHRAVQQGALAPRRHTLQGATVGLLDNTKRNSKPLLAAIGRELKEHYGVEDVIELSKPSASLPVAGDQLDRLARCHVIIAGVGD